MKYSIIIPVYNRPDEIKELLESLTLQTFQNFEILIIEDGSKPELCCEDIVKSFADKLEIFYYFKENSGQGFSRNFGYERANGDYFIVFDSDCIIPENYLNTVDKYLKNNYLDAYGGPDAAHDSFTPVQKAISYAMTSTLSTGGIRGRKKHIGTFHPRSFNMGISREVYEKSKGYIITRRGEDIEFSIRIHSLGFKIGLIPDAFVYHKRRTNFRQFFKQLHFFGTARINIGRFFSKEVKWVHFFPTAFMFFLFCIPMMFFVSKILFYTQIVCLGIYISAVFMEALLKNKNFKIACLGLVAVFTQLLAYGMGFLSELLKGKREQEILK